MRNRKSVIAINTLAFHGCPLDTALEEIAQLTDCVELVFIAKYDPTLCEDHFNQNNARVLTRRLEQLRLKIISMGSHMDLGQTNAATVFKKRMEFAKAIGAGTIITNASRKACQMAFYKNMDELIAYAEKMDLIIALENPGDGHDQLLGDGIKGIAVLERLGSDRIRLNYDFSNVFTYSKGKKHPDLELSELLPYIGHLHLKNVKFQKGVWMVSSIGEGVIDYRDLFQQFPSLWNIPMSIELPIGFGYDAQFDFALRETLTGPPLGRIRRILSGSLEFLRSIRN